MDITNIKIKNIKGYGDPGLDWNLSQTPIKSNKINLVVAPNGTGKSSLAVALQYADSAYFLHYNPSIKDIEADLLARHEQNLQTSWGKGLPFLQVLIEEVNKYVRGDKSYDPYAVATALRIKIEKSVYDSLSHNNQVEFLTGTKCKTTKQKLKFAEDNGVSVNEIFYMAIPITNDADHLTYIKGTNKLDEHPLVYKLNHPVLRHIVSEVFDYPRNAITINTIH